jgi:hypothetical protein
VKIFPLRDTCFPSHPSDLALWLRRNLPNRQRHRLTDAEEHSCECNGWATLNSLRKFDLGLWPILNFEEFLWGEENAVWFAEFRRSDQCCVELYLPILFHLIS